MKIKCKYCDKEINKCGIKAHEKMCKKLTKEIKNNTIASLEDIFEYWTNVFNDPKVGNRDRLKASELLAKAKGGFVEKVEVKKVETDWFIDEDTTNG